MPNRRGFMRAVGGLAAAMSMDRSSLGAILNVQHPSRVTLKARKLVSCVYVTQELLDDAAAFDVSAWIRESYGNVPVIKF